MIRLTRSFLIPYAVFGIIYVLMNMKDPSGALRNLIYGISFSKKWFTDVQSIGPVYFILMLFLIRAIYLPAAKYIPDIYLAPVMMLLSFFGYLPGANGCWLPWSLDIALYGMIFYHAGHMLRKTGLMKSITGWYPSYFVLSSFWVYMIYKGGMEIAVRDYGSYGVTLPGVLSAAMLMLMLCRACCVYFPRAIVRLTALAGRSTLYILIIHCLFSGRISRLLENWYTKGYQGHMVMNLLVSLAAGMIVFEAWQFIKRFLYAAGPAEG